MKTHGIRGGASRDDGGGGSAEEAWGASDMAGTQLTEQLNKKKAHGLNCAEFQHHYCARCWAYCVSFLASFHVVIVWLPILNALLDCRASAIMSYSLTV